MADENIIQSRPECNQVNRTRAKALLRFFSMDSEINVAPPNIASTPEITYKFTTKDFFLKIAQLLNGIICVGFYGEGVKVMPKSVTFLSFPNVVFGSFIIITAVIIMSYMLGQVMPDVLVRVFICIGVILHFISATVTVTIWCSTKIHKPELQLAKDLLLAQAVLSYCNCLLLGLDMYFSIKKAIAFET